MTGPRGMSAAQRRVFAEAKECGQCPELLPGLMARPGCVLLGTTTSTGVRQVFEVDRAGAISPVSAGAVAS